MRDPDGILISSSGKKRDQINKIINERGEITTDTIEIQKITKEYCKQLHANNLALWKTQINF